MAKNLGTKRKDNTKMPKEAVDRARNFVVMGRTIAKVLDLQAIAYDPGIRFVDNRNEYNRMEIGTEFAKRLFEYLTKNGVQPENPGF